MSCRILITGSRNWTDRQVIEDAILAAVNAFGLPARPSEVTVIHGAAPGADTLADDIAEEYKFITESHPADWAKHGKAAGPRRNTEMVDAGADVCFAFLHPDSRGTVDCSNKAENAGIPVFRFYDRLRGNKSEFENEGEAYTLIQEAIAKMGGGKSNG